MGEDSSDKPKGQANLKATQHRVGHGTSFQDKEHLPAHQETPKEAKESSLGWLKMGVNSAFPFGGPQAGLPSQERAPRDIKESGSFRQARICLVLRCQSELRLGYS